MQPRVRLPSKGYKPPTIPEGVKITRYFHGRDSAGRGAIVQQSASQQYVQVDDPTSHQGYGWHPYPLGTFKELRR